MYYGVQYNAVYEGDDVLALCAGIKDDLELGAI